MSTVTYADVAESIAELMGGATSVDAWMAGKFLSGPLMGNRPVDLVLAGRGQEVLDLIEALKDGAFL